MSWQAVVEILRAEVPDQAARIEARLRAELNGLAIYIPHKARLSRDEAHAAVRRHRGNVDQAARELGIHRTTLYRRLVR